MESPIAQQLRYLNRIREVENTWIPLSDGTRLAARYWIPEDAEAEPVPAILEYFPYRKRDHTKRRDETVHPYFAGHGFCAIRVDMRGSGDSAGVLLDEYLKQEQDDALEVIAWIAAQPWCTGRVGMMGRSWGGFNSLQVAARRPPALTGILTIHSSVDRYTDDIHYMGGCLLTANPQWAFTMLCRNAQPPDPHYVGSHWRDIWRQRLEANYPWLVHWLRHQRRDAYWKHGSVCEDYAAIQCPVYAMGGWADGYANAVPRLLEGLQVPRKGLVGPWGHNFPHTASPGPTIGFLQEAVRWWEYCLKDIDNGLMTEAGYRVWMQEGSAPGRRQNERPGRWVAEPAWPSPRIEMRDYALNRDGLDTVAGDTVAMTLQCPQTIGLASLQWSNKGTGDDTAEDPGDQRFDDCRSLCFDSRPLEAPVEVLGSPCVALELAVDRPWAHVCVRLCEVTPRGLSGRVTYGLRNLALDPAGEERALLMPGKRTRVEIPLNHVAYRFAPGARIRVAVSTALWPVTWPSRDVPVLTVFSGASRLRLPVRPPRPEDAHLRAFPPPTAPSPAPTTVLRPPRPHMVRVTHDPVRNRATVFDVQDGGRVRIDRDGWEFGSRSEMRRSIVEDDPLSARMQLNAELEFHRAGELDARIEATCAVHADYDHFWIEACLSAYDDGRAFFARSWSEKIARDTC